jgi:hypothetical protein
MRLTRKRIEVLTVNEGVGVTKSSFEIDKVLNLSCSIIEWSVLLDSVLHAMSFYGDCRSWNAC